LVDSAASSSTLYTNGERRKLRFWIVAGFGASLGVIGLFLAGSMFQITLFSVSAAILAVCLVGEAVGMRDRRIRRRTADRFASFISNDAIASVVTGRDGRVIIGNEAAEERFQLVNFDGLTMRDLLNQTLANPSATLSKLSAQAKTAGSAQEDIVTGHGMMRLTAHQVSDGALIWRLIELGPATRSTETVAPPVTIVGNDGVILDMNAPAQKLIGREAKTVGDLFGETFAPGEVCDLNTATGTLSAFVGAMDAGGGKQAYVLLPDRDGSKERQNWSVFQNLPVSLLKVSGDGHVQSFNKVAAQMIGVALTEGAHLSEFMEGLGRPITDWLQDCLSDRIAHPSEFLRLKRADKEVFVQVTLDKITENGVPALIAVLNDATELKSLEAQFVQSQKMQAIGQLAGGVAHDFNNLLTAISGHCDLLLLRHDQGDPDFSDLVQINQNANRAAALVGQLLAFSRKQTLRPETLDMRDTLADLTHLLNRLVGEKVSLTLNHDPVLRPIRADKRQLEQVLMNLVVNARDAMPKGGEIRIDTECIRLKRPLSRDRVSVPPGEYVTVRVSDEGVGIPFDKLQKVFEPFFTTKRTGEGTGLGLSTAYGIVKQTGGYIFVDSTVNVGTCFTLYFPVLEKDQPVLRMPERNVKKPVGKHGEGVILLVEDEAPVRAFASRALRLRGYTVLEADSAEAALKTLADGSLSVDVFVTDVVMPGMDGPTWVREALKERPNVRVVFVSGYAEDSFSEVQMKIPNSVFLPKPFSLNELTETVHQQMH